MIRRLRPRLSYANIIATLALFLALGGTGWAATRLARNSVGPAQIRTNAVGPAEVRTGAVRAPEIRNGSIGLQELSAAAREALRGAAGPAGPEGPRGPQGPTGPSGAPALWAAVNEAGQRVGGNAVRSSNNGPGVYEVGFARNVDGCAATATIARVQAAQDPAPGLISVRPSNSALTVLTYNPGGAAAERPFYLVVTC